MHWLLISVRACPSPEKGWGRGGVSNDKHKKKYLVLPLELCNEEKVQPYDDTLMCSFPTFWFRICLTRRFLTAEENGLMGSKKSSKANLLGTKLQSAFPFCQSAQESTPHACREAENYQVFSDSQCFHLTIKGHCLAIIILYLYVRPEKHISIFKAKFAEDKGHHSVGSSAAAPTSTAVQSPRLSAGGRQPILKTDGFPEEKTARMLRVHLKDIAMLNASQVRLFKRNHLGNAEPEPGFT